MIERRILPGKLMMVLTASFLLVVLALVVTEASAQDTDDPVARGKYLTTVAGCVTCHTPYQAKYLDPTKLKPEELADLGLAESRTLDMTKMFGGGREFDLGPGGKISSANLTSDKDTGIGSWTDDQIEVAMRYGVRKDQTRLHPLMPYNNFTNMAKADVKAIIAYLRTLPAVSNKVARTEPKGLPPVAAPSTSIPEKAPSATDKIARGGYLTNVVLSCGDCHTPLDQNTGAPIVAKKLAGGQPYEGPWGIVYGGNLTADKDTGLGKWTDDQIKTAITTGVSLDGRRLLLMPWEGYSVLTSQDADAVVAYLRSLPAVRNEIPSPSVQGPFLQNIKK